MLTFSASHMASMRIIAGTHATIVRILLHLALASSQLWWHLHAQFRREWLAHAQDVNLAAMRSVSRGAQ